MNNIIKKDSTDLEIKQNALNYLDSKYSNLTDEQKGQFASLCVIHKLNPLLNEIYAIRYGNNFNIIVNHEVYLRKALQSNLLAGWEFEIDKTDAKNPVITCQVKRYVRDNIATFSYSAIFKEYSTGKSLWATKPFAMLEKVALSLAIRKAFADVIANMPPIKEEIEQEQITYSSDKPKIKNLEDSKIPNDDEIDKVINDLELEANQETKEKATAIIQDTEQNELLINVSEGDK